MAHPDGCADHEEEVTILNPKFISLMAEYGPDLLFGTLSQNVFERIHEAM